MYSFRGSVAVPAWTHRSPEHPGTGTGRRRWSVETRRVSGETSRYGISRGVRLFFFPRASLVSHTRDVRARGAAPQPLYRSGSGDALSRLGNATRDAAQRTVTPTRHDTDGDADRRRPLSPLSVSRYHAPRAPAATRAASTLSALSDPVSGGGGGGKSPSYHVYKSLTHWLYPMSPGDPISSQTEAPHSPARPVAP